MILGHDCEGRPIRAGDKVVVVRVEWPPGWRLVNTVVVAERREVGGTIVLQSDAATEIAKEHGYRILLSFPERLRLLPKDQHTPADNFEWRTCLTS